MKSNNSITVTAPTTTDATTTTTWRVGDIAWVTQPDWAARLGGFEVRITNIILSARPGQGFIARCEHACGRSFWFDAQELATHATHVVAANSEVHP